MELHAQRKSSGVGKWIVGIALILLLFLSLVSPRFWGFGSDEPEGRYSALPRLGSQHKPAAPAPQPKQADSSTTNAGALPQGGALPRLPKAINDLPAGEVLLPIIGKPKSLVADSQAAAKPIPGPRIFGAGAVKDQQAGAAPSQPALPILTFPDAQQNSTNDSATLDPLAYHPDSAALNDLGNGQHDPPSAGQISNQPGRTTLHTSPATLNNSGEAETPLTRDEIVRARWPWLRPRRMETYLDRLTGHAQCEMWATDVRWLIEETYSPDDLSANLPALQEQVRIADEVIAELGNSEFAAPMRRAAYALQRNLVAWSASADSLQISTEAAENTISADALRELAQCIASVEATLANSRDRDAWRRYLRLDELAAFAAQGARTGDAFFVHDLTYLLNDVAERSTSSSLTVGQRQFLQTGTLGEFQTLLVRMTAEPADWSALLTAIEEYEFSGLPADAEQVAAQIQSLRATRVPADLQLAEKLDGYYRNNNVRFVVSDEFLTRMLPPQADRTEITDDTILGVPIHGQSNTKTRLAMRMAPGDSTALELLVFGDVDSLTQGESGPVRTYNHTNATYVVHKKLVLDGHGIRALPGRVEVTADSRLQCLETDFDDIPLVGSIVRSVAEDKVEESRDEARREIEKRISAKVLDRVDGEADQGFVKMNERLFRHIGTVQKLGLEPAAWFQHPDNNRLAVHVRMAAGEQLAAHTPRPQALSNSVASVQIHQSTLNNVLESLDFNGRTLTVEEAFVHVMEKLTLGMSFASVEGGDAEITFATENAITVQLEDGLVKLSLRLEQVQAEEGSWGPLSVYVSYRPVPAGAGYALYREGPISLDSRALRFRDRIVLRGVFSKVFKKDEPVSVLGHALRSDPRFAGLGVTQLAIEDGWVGLSIGPALDRIVESPKDAEEGLNLRR